MDTPVEPATENGGIKSLPRNVWAVSLTSFFMDISSEMVINLLPLFLSNVLGIRTNIIGIIEGVAEATASLLKIFSGWLSDRTHGRKWIAVLGYGISALSKPFFLIANTWELVAGVRWADRVGKGIRTSPRDALVADSVNEKQRGIAFGFHRAADTSGAMLGLVIAVVVVLIAQSGDINLGANTFHTIVWISLIPAFLAVLSLAIGARDVAVSKQRAAPKFAFKSLGKDFIIFTLIVGIFTLGNSSDAFLTLRAQERGMNVIGILVMMIVFNLVYALISTPAGSLSDRIGRKRLIVGGWLVYAVIYFGFAAAQDAWQVFALYVAYGLYYGMAYGASNAMIADIVPDNLRGTAYGTYNAVMGIITFPASVIAGILWQGVGSWSGFGPSAPFLFGAVLSFLAAILFLVWRPSKKIA